jgi:hypothetical protein
MNAVKPNLFVSAPKPWRINSFYRALLVLTKNRGAITLGKLNAMVFSKGEIVQLPDGAVIYCPPDPHFFGFILGTHETHVSSLLKQLLKPGDVCFDVGANIGYFSNIMAKIVGPTGQVWAFEPVPENFDVLQINATLANKACRVVRPIHAAVSDQPGKVRIVRKEFSTYHQVARIVAGVISSDSESVEAVALEDEFSAHQIEQSISVLKVDVEGHEWPVIKGCEKLMRRGLVRNMIVELTPGPEMQSIQTLFEELDVQYKCWLDNQWQAIKLIDLPVRTDIWAVMPSPVVK